MNKGQLRAACKAAGISYRSLSVDGMRAALSARELPQQPIVNPIAAAAAMVTPAINTGDLKQVTDGIEIEKNRQEGLFGIKRPSKGGVTHQVWLTVEALKSTLGRWPDRSEAISACTLQGINPATAATQYMLCRKFHGATGRLPKVAPVAVAA